jgi:hypothetical protein
MDPKDFLPFRISSGWFFSSWMVVTLRGGLSISTGSEIADDCKLSVAARLGRGLSRSKSEELYLAGGRGA